MRTTKQKIDLIDTRRHTCKSGKEYIIPVTGYYDDDGVMNIEFHYGVIDDVDFAELGNWQTAYVGRLGRRVA